jgi:hypothetical protein
VCTTTVRATRQPFYESLGPATYVPPQHQHRNACGATRDFTGATAQGPGRLSQLARPVPVGTDLDLPPETAARTAAAAPAHTRRNWESRSRAFALALTARAATACRCSSASPRTPPAGQFFVIDAFTRPEADAQKIGRHAGFAPGSRTLDRYRDVELGRDDGSADGLLRS